MARLIIHVESTALLNWDTANQLGTRVTEVRRRQLKKGGCVVWVWGSGVLGAQPGARDKWWQETALGFLPDLTNWTPGKGVREQLQLAEKTIVDTKILLRDWILKQRRGQGAIVCLDFHDRKGIDIKGCEKDLRNPRVAWALGVSAKCWCFEVACSATVVQCKYAPVFWDCDCFQVLDCQAVTPTYLTGFLPASVKTMSARQSYQCCSPAAALCLWALHLYIKIIWLIME